MPIDSNELLKINPQLMYTHRIPNLHVAASLLTFGCESFVSMVQWKERNLLKSLCDNITRNPPTIEQIQKIRVFIFDRLSDCIKLTICFENYMKCTLLRQGYIVHKLGRESFTELNKEQNKRPILWQEVLDNGIVETKNWPNVPEPTFRQQVKGILNQTINMSNLLSDGYQNIIGLDDEVLKICNPLFMYRNNLHLYMGIDFSIGNENYNELITIAQFINDKIVKNQNEFADLLGLGIDKKLQELTYLS